MLSGSFGNTFTTGYRLQVDWSATQDISANTSTITMNLYLISLGSSYTINSSATKTGSQTCDGSSNSFSTAGAGLSGNQKKLINTFTHTVAHNADGTKQISMSAVYNIAVTLNGTYFSSVSCSSGTVTLDTIPRASDLTSGCDWTAGTQNLAISISRAVSSFHHSVEVRVQKPDGNWVYIGARDGIETSTTFTFTLDENTAIYNSIQQYENRPSWVRLITFDSSNNMIGYKDYYGTVYGAGIAKISFNNPNIGDSISATLTGMQNYNGFQYTGIFKIAGTTIKTFTFDPATPNVTLTFTQAEINQMYSLTPNSNSVSGQVTVTSKYNGVDLNDGIPAPQYDPNFNFIAYVTNSNPQFSASSISYADVNDTTKVMTGNDQYIIQNQSSLTAFVNTPATAINGASFTKYVVTINGKQGEIDTATGNVNIGAIDASTNQSLTITAIDSRGNSTSVSITVNVVPYAEPTLAISLDRANKFENSTTLRVSGSFSVMNIGGTNKNAIVSLVYRYKEKGAETFGSDQTLTFTTNNGTFIATNVVIDLDNTKSWDFEVSVQDKIETVTDPASVGTGQPIFFIDSGRMSVGVGKLPTQNNALEVQGLIDVTGNGNFGSLTVLGTSTLQDLSVTGTSSLKDINSTNLKTTDWVKANSIEVGYGLNSDSPSTQAGFVDFHSSGGGFNDAIDYDARIISWGGDKTRTGYGSLQFQAGEFVFHPLNGGKSVSIGGDINTIIGTKSEANLSLQNGWVDYYTRYGGAYDNARYVKYPTGQVQLKGLIADGGAGTVCAVLPVGCRPWGQRIFSCLDGSGVGRRVDVANDGSIIVANANGWVDLSTISFYAER